MSLLSNADVETFSAARVVTHGCGTPLWIPPHFEPAGALTWEETPSINEPGRLNKPKETLL